MKKEGQSKISNIKCLGIHCGKIIELPSYISNEQYDGDLRCQECLSLMHISLRKGVIAKYGLKDDKSETTKGWERLNEIRARLKAHNCE